MASIEDAAEAAGGELPAETVGEMCLTGLRELDRIAYLQFAAVYKGFADPGEFTGSCAGWGSSHPGKWAIQAGRFRPVRSVELVVTSLNGLRRAKQER